MGRTLARPRRPEGGKAANGRADRPGGGARWGGYTPPPVSLRILSWNVNGLRACASKGFRRWLDRTDGFVACVQEVRAREEDLPRRLRRAPRLDGRAGRRRAPRLQRRRASTRGARPTRSTSALAPEFDGEARLQLARFGRLSLANVYFPQGNGERYDNSRVPFKLRLLPRPRTIASADERAAGQRVVVIGDFNTAHRELDLARPRDNRRTSGFLPEERAELDRWLRRRLDRQLPLLRARRRPLHLVEELPDRPPQPATSAGASTSPWSAPRRAASSASSFIQRKVLGSDHCPIGIELDPAVTG